jgi:hypothetical protein
MKLNIIAQCTDSTHQDGVEKIVNEIKGDLLVHG